MEARSLDERVAILEQKVGDLASLVLETWSQSDFVAVSRRNPAITPVIAVPIRTAADTRRASSSHRDIAYQPTPGMWMSTPIR